MAKYELMVVVDPFLEETDNQAMVEKAQDQIKKRGGNITQVDAWGKRRLAYPINKKVEGYYILITFEGDLEGAAIAEAERTLRLDEKIMRVMVTRIPTIKPRKVKKKDAEANRSSDAPNSAGQAGQQPAQR